MIMQGGPPTIRARDVAARVARVTSPQNGAGPAQSTCPEGLAATPEPADIQVQVQAMQQQVSRLRHAGNRTCTRVAMRSIKGAHSLDPSAVPGPCRRCPR